MAHHAYFAAGEREATLAQARAFVQRELGELPNDVVQLSFELFSVDDARRLIDVAGTSGNAGKKVIIASLSRIFHEAQNALLKVLEEPPPGALIILCVPSEGILIPTLRSRLLPLPSSGAGSLAEHRTARFLDLPPAQQKKTITQLLERSKSDKDDVKQRARREAIELVQDLAEDAYAQLHASDNGGAQVAALHLLQDLAAFTPILYERSAPMKLIFEHLLLVLSQKSPIRSV